MKTLPIVCILIFACFVILCIKQLPKPEPSYWSSYSYFEEQSYEQYEMQEIDKVAREYAAKGIDPDSVWVFR